MRRWNQHRIAATRLLGAASAAGLAATAVSLAAGAPTAWAGPQGTLGTLGTLGPAPAGQRETVTVYLRQPRAAAAERFAAAVSDPRNVLYRHFLTPAQYRGRCAPDAASAARVGGYLGARGLAIAPVPANHLYVQASGTVAQLQNAFHTTLLAYNSGGRPAIAPASAPGASGQLQLRAVRRLPAAGRGQSGVGRRP